MKKISNTHLQLFEDRSDAARRVVVKTIGSQVEGVRGGVGMVCAYGGRVFVATWRAASRLGTAPPNHRTAIRITHSIQKEARYPVPPRKNSACPARNGRPMWLE